MANIKLKNNYWVTESIYDTTDSKTQKQVNADLHQDIEDTVIVSDTQPSSAANQIWLPQTIGEGVQVPTWAEHQELHDGVSELNNSLAALNDTPSLDDIAINNITYAQMFFGDYNLLSPLYLDGWTWRPMIVNAGSPEIVENPNSVSLSHNVLKCFGTTSTQLCFPSSENATTFTQDHAYYCACVIKVSRYTSGSCGLVFESSILPKLSETIVGDWKIISNISTSASTAIKKVYVGTANSANADCYIACPVIIDLTAMGLISYTKLEIDELFSKYIAITDSINFKIRRLQKKKPKIAAAVMDASSDENRFYGVLQLAAVAQKKLVNPWYSPKAHETYLVEKGVVCELPNHNGAFYENYTFDTLFAKNATTGTRPASTIKVLNAITALEYNLDLNEQYTIESGDVIAGSGSAYAAGDVLTIKDLLHAMFLESSNTCANALGTCVGRKILHNSSATNTNARNAFVAQMSVRSQAIGGSSWNGNASGYNSTAYLKPIDMLRILIEASSFQEILRVWNKKSYTVKVGGTNARDIEIVTTVANTTLENEYYIFGGKTGSAAGYRALVLILEPK